MILKLLAGNIINRGRALFPTRCMAIIVPRVTKLLVPEQYHKKKTHTHTTIKTMRWSHWLNYYSIYMPRSITAYVHLDYRVLLLH